mgnify:FL=1
MKIINKEPFTVEHELIEKILYDKVKKIRKIPIKDIYTRSQQVKRPQLIKKTTHFVPSRDPNVVVMAKGRAQGKCQLCGEDAPFENKYREPFLEAHHVKWLARGGDDVITNAVGLCPNCHRKMHVLGRKDDVRILARKAQNVTFFT